jgi:hypothetical protein
MRRSLRQPSPGLAPAQQQLAYAAENPQGGDPTQRSVRCDATPSCSHEVLVVGCHRVGTESHTFGAARPMACGRATHVPDRTGRRADAVTHGSPRVPDLRRCWRSSRRRSLIDLWSCLSRGRRSGDMRCLDRCQNGSVEREVSDQARRWWTVLRVRVDELAHGRSVRASSSMVAPSWSTRLTVTDACCRVSK